MNTYTAFAPRPFLFGGVMVAPPPSQMRVGTCSYQSPHALHLNFDGRNLPPPLKGEQQPIGDRALNHCRIPDAEVDQRYLEPQPCLDVCHDSVSVHPVLVEDECLFLAYNAMVKAGVFKVPK